MFLPNSFGDTGGGNIKPGGGFGRKNAARPEKYRPGGPVLPSAHSFIENTAHQGFGCPGAQVVMSWMEHGAGVAGRLDICGKHNTK